MGKHKRFKYLPAVFFIILFLAVAGILLAVFLYKNDKGGNILAGASPDTSAIQLYYYDGETVMVRTLYDSGEEFTYGEYLSLQKQIDGQWYTMPVRADNICFLDIACILPDGESASKTYNLDIYGTLEPGVYRLVVEMLSVEFLVGHGDDGTSCLRSC